MKNVVTLLLALCTLGAIAQNSSGEIKGRVFDKATGETMPGVSVYVEVNNQQVGTITDVDGRFTLKPLQPGIYTLTYSSMGSQTQEITNVQVKPDKITFMDEQQMVAAVYEITVKGEMAEVVARRPKKDRLIDPQDPTALITDWTKLEKTPSAKNPVKAVQMMSPEISSGGREDGELYFKGARSDASGFYIDGVKLRGSSLRLPGSAISTITAYTGGVPAKYGDATGGIVVIEVKSYTELYNRWKAFQP